MICHNNLATLGLEAGIDVSLFSTFDYQSQFYFYYRTYTLHDQSSALVRKRPSEHPLSEVVVDVVGWRL